MQYPSLFFIMCVPIAIVHATTANFEDNIGANLFDELSLDYMLSNTEYGFQQGELFDEPLESFSNFIPNYNHPDDSLIAAEQTWSLPENGSGDLDLMLLDSNNLNSGFLLADHEDLGWSSMVPGNDDLDSGSMVSGNEYLDWDVMVSSDNDPDAYILAGESSCDVSNVGDSMLFGKVRRGESCRAPPVGQAPQEEKNQPQEPVDNDLLNPSNIAKTIRALFPTDFNQCPRETFPTANVPVCKDERLVDDIIPDDLGSYYVVNVSFGTSLHVPPFSYSLEILSNC